MKNNYLILLVVSILLTSCVQETTSLKEFPAITNSDIESLIDQDRLFYKYTHWDSTSLNIDYTVKDDTGEFCKIIQEDLDTYSEWEDFAKKTYSKELLENKLLTVKETIKNIDGDAYVRPGSRGNPISQSYDYEILSFEENKAIVEVEFTSLHEEDYGESVIYTYEMSKNESTWKITDIKLKTCN